MSVPDERMDRFASKYDPPLHPRVVEVQFTLLDPKEIRRSSVVEVSQITIYDKNLPNVGGINDHRMGTVDRRVACGTCGHNVENDVGHPGFIRFALPVYHPLFIQTVLKVLRCLCYFCSRIITHRDDTRVTKLVETLDGRQRLSHLVTILKSVDICAHCEHRQPLYNKNNWQIRTDWTVARGKDKKLPVDVTSRIFTAADAHNIMR